MFESAWDLGCEEWRESRGFEIGALSTVLEERKRRPTSVVVITFALHAKGREFEPHVDQFFNFYLCVPLLHGDFNSFFC